MRTSGRLSWLAVLAGLLLIQTMGESVALADEPTVMPSCRLRVFLLVEKGVLTPEQRDTVRDEVMRIWTPYGLAIEWRTVPGAHVPGTVSIMVRETFRHVPGPRTRGGVAIAWTMFNEIGPLPYIRASAEAARDVAAAARIAGREVLGLPETTQHRFIALVIGRSIAHEVGHYLLGRRHSAIGLMRQVIPPDDYFGARDLHFSLTGAEVAALARSAVWQACMASSETASPAD